MCQASIYVTKCKRMKYWYKEILTIYKKKTGKRDNWEVKQF